ncbi:MAG TPA: alpha/beta hydrolase [Verrucomicrobiae bacterium]|nr:alpha/beta hydrolase [Verrucomicrobiae bacterium]
MPDPTPRSAEPKSWLEAGHAFAYGRHQVFYAERGDRTADTALLLIHGFPTSSWDWHRLWDALGARFARVIAPDMIGFGFSAKPKDHAYSILDQATLHEQLLAKLGVKRVHILAHDYGDTVAQELLARQLDGGTPRIESCVLLNGGLFPETHRARTIQKLLLTPVGPLLARLMGQSSFDKSFSAVFGARTQPTPLELADFWTLIRREKGHLLFPKLIGYMPERIRHRERWVGALQKTRVPLRVIDGADDPVSGAHMVARYRELVPVPDTVLLPGIGHYPQVEDPQGVLRALLEFHDRLR